MDPQTDVPSPASLLCAGALPIIHCTLACRPWLRPAALLGYTLLSGVAGWRALTAPSTSARLRAFGWQAAARLLVFGARGAGLGSGAPGPKMFPPQCPGNRTPQGGRQSCISPWGLD